MKVAPLMRAIKDTTRALETVLLRSTRGFCILASIMMKRCP